MCGLKARAVNIINLLNAIVNKKKTVHILKVVLKIDRLGDLSSYVASNQLIFDFLGAIMQALCRISSSKE